MRTIIDTHGRPTPIFYELPVRERAFIIQHERTHFYFQRQTMDACERMKDALTFMDLEDSIRSLDLLPIHEAKGRYRRILMGEF